ncbi:MAG: hypothetical protein M3P84_12845, partial [Chloroflexota bacterium]|nr:hypothetical protein [Chloroflexota bacterium]
PSPSTAGVIVSPPATTDPRLVLTRDQLVEALGSGVVPIGSIVIANVTIAPVILPSFPPEQGTVAGKIGPIRVHWASDPSLSATDLHQIALRVRPDGEVDYLGPVGTSRDGADGSTYGLFLVQTARGPTLVRRTDCAAPVTPDPCPLGQGDARTVNLGPVFVAKP